MIKFNIGSLIKVLLSFVFLTCGLIATNESQISESNDNVKLFYFKDKNGEVIRFFPEINKNKMVDFVFPIEQVAKLSPVFKAMIESGCRDSNSFVLDMDEDAAWLIYNYFNYRIFDLMLVEKSKHLKVVLLEKFKYLNFERIKDLILKSPYVLDILHFAQEWQIGDLEELILSNFFTTTKKHNLFVALNAIDLKDLIDKLNLNEVNRKRAINNYEKESLKDFVKINKISEYNIKSSILNKYDYIESLINSKNNYNNNIDYIFSSVDKNINCFINK